MSYAKVLGATKRQDGYLEGNGYLVSWCIGHLVELAPPNVYDEKFIKWSIADLPILPQKWQYLVSASTKKQFGILQKLMHRPDVDSIICATDAGREGELIFRLVYQQAGCKKPFSRLWLSSMEENAIREGFAHLKPSTEYDALYNAALCRERADWMVGINASRLFSCLYNQPLAVGRVMTPVQPMEIFLPSWRVNSTHPVSMLNLQALSSYFIIASSNSRYRLTVYDKASEFCAVHGSLHCCTQRKQKIRTLLQSETGSDFSCLVGQAGLEPAITPL